MAPLNRIWETLRYGYLPLQGVGRHLSLKSLRPLAFAEACAEAAPAHFFPTAPRDLGNQAIREVFL
jgi:hypothetical protein